MTQPYSCNSCCSTHCCLTRQPWLPVGEPAHLPCEDMDWWDWTFMSPESIIYWTVHGDRPLRARARASVRTRGDQP